MGQLARRHERMNITEFLLARIAEDEEAAQNGMSDSQYGHYADTAAEEVIAMGWGEGAASEGMEHFSRWLPDRVLAECEAKRRIVERYENTIFDHWAEPDHEYENWILPL